MYLRSKLGGKASTLFFINVTESDKGSGCLLAFE